MLSEEMRLLYVALTRAKEQLFISYVVNSSYENKIRNIAMAIEMADGLTPSIIKTANSMQDWLTMSLLLDKNNDYLRRFCDDSVITSYSIHYTKLYDWAAGSVPLP